MIFKFRITTNASTVTVTINTNLAITFSLMLKNFSRTGSRYAVLRHPDDLSARILDVSDPAQALFGIFRVRCENRYDLADPEVLFPQIVPAHTDQRHTLELECLRFALGILRLKIKIDVWIYPIDFLEHTRFGERPVVVKF
jgi:hypothetical protein